jgi:hypothetical protein
MITSNLKVYAGAVAGFAFGFLVCYMALVSDGLEITGKNQTTLRTGPSSFHQNNGKVILTSEPQKAAPKTITVGQLSSKADDERIFRVPSTIAKIIIPSLLQNNDSEISDLSILPYGLPLKEVSKLSAFLNLKAKEISKLEAENSELIETENGDQFIKIKPFSEEGKKLKSEIESEIDKSFAGFDDDRSSLFKQQLFKTILYDDFGVTQREISIDDATGPTGNLGHVFTISRYNEGGQLVSKRSDQWSLSLMNGRFASILEKHKTKIAP